MRENSKPPQPQTFEGIAFHATLSVPLAKKEGAAKSRMPQGTARISCFRINTDDHTEAVLRRPGANCPLCAIAPGHKDVRPHS